MGVTRYPLPILNKILIENYDLYYCPLEIDFSTKLNIIFGTNGLGKTTLLNILQYSIIGPYTEGRQIRSYKGEQKIRRPIYDDDYFRLRMREQREDARVTIWFTLGETVFQVSHSLFDNILLEVNINSKKLSGTQVNYKKYEAWCFAQENNSNKAQLKDTLISKYHQTLVDVSGLPDIDSLITMMTECMFFTEDRNFTFWSGGLSNLIISKYFMDQDTYKKFVLEQQRVKQLDSQQRLKTYELSFIRKFLKDKSVEQKGKKYSLDDLRQVQESLEHLQNSVNRGEQQIQKLENERIENRVIVEDLKSQINVLDLSWYKAVFPNPYKKAFNQYSPSLLSGICPFCGAEKEFNIKLDKCFLCGNDIEVAKPTNLVDIELQKKNLEIELKKAEKTYSSITASISSAMKSQNSLMKQTNDLKSQDARIRGYLDNSNNIDYDRLKNLENERDQFTAQLSTAKSSYAKTIAELDQKILSYFQAYSKVFKKYASSFFGNLQSVEISLVGDEGEKLFEFSLNRKKRLNAYSLSESQRIFVDMAFRLSILEYFHKTSYFMCETPDSTLDINSENHAVKTFSAFIQSGNTLFLSANARNSNLITELLEEYSSDVNIINLFDISTSAPNRFKGLEDLSIYKFIREKGLVNHGKR